MTEINREIGQRPELSWIDVGLIDVDNNYQREIKPRLVDRILSNFTWRKFGAVSLSRKPDGRYNVVEGQHRCKAATLHPDVDAVPAVIVEHTDAASEAESFIGINSNRMAVTPIEKYWAGLTAGDANAKAIASVLSAAECDVVPAYGYYKPHLTSAVSALERCLKRSGNGPTRRALVVIRQAWPTDDQALRGVLISAIARLIKENHQVISDEALVSAIRSQSYKDMTAAAESFRKLSGGAADTALARTIAELYNRGKRTSTIFFGSSS